MRAPLLAVWVTAALSLQCGVKPVAPPDAGEPDAGVMESDGR